MQAAVAFTQEAGTKPVQAVRTLEQLRSVLGAGEHLGDMVWWTLNDASLDRATLVARWTGAGLPQELLPEPPTGEKALRLAVRACQVGQAEHLVRLAKDSDGELIYAVVREENLGGGILAHRQEARVELRKAAGAVTSDAPGHVLVRTIQDAFVQFRDTHTADDVRRTVVKTLHTLAAVTLREGGGVYWVPRTHAVTVRRLEQAVSQVGQSTFHVVPVHHTEDASRTLGVVARGSLETELTALRDELEAFKAQPPERPSTLQRRLEAFEELRSRAQLYRDILHVQVEDLEQHLTSMASSVEQMLAVQEAA
ncbi:MAG TPA: DUF6744 family protein [Myxococcaceae bacterium]|jgi:hypothetical protein